MWKRQLENIHYPNGVYIRKDDHENGYPPIRLVLNSGEYIDVTPTMLCYLPDNCWRRRSARCVRSPNGFLVEACTLSSILFTRYQREGYIKVGVRIDSCAPYVVRALSRWKAPRCIYQREEYTLALIPDFQLYSLLDQIHEEYQHGTRIYRCSEKKTPRSQERY